ncbi:hypothetical protein BaRGS_00027574 [Batillaria attramentaria]|uniref:Uncharacterized protein n=1 Tax=Batillaria attramentaria TaxID=370345 RepID=A0ABD0K2N2_9CAEN
MGMADEKNSAVRKYFQTVCQYLLKKLPLTEPLLHHIHVVDPAKQLTAEPSSLLYLPDRFPVVITEESSKDAVMEEFARYQVSDIQAFFEEG